MSESELMLPLSHSVTVPPPRERPVSLATPLSPLPNTPGSIHSAPHPESPPCSTPPGRSPPLAPALALRLPCGLAPALWPCACPVAFLLIGLCPFDPFSTAARGTLQKYQCRHQPHPCLKACHAMPCYVASTVFDSATPRTAARQAPLSSAAHQAFRIPAQAKALPDGAGPSLQPRLLQQADQCLTATSGPLHTLSPCSGRSFSSVLSLGWLPRRHSHLEPCPPQSCLQTLKPVSLHHGCKQWVLAGSPPREHTGALSAAARTAGIRGKGVGCEAALPVSAGLWDPTLRRRGPEVPR